MLMFVSTFVRYMMWSIEFLLFPPICFATTAVVASLVTAIVKQKPFSDISIRKNTARIVVLQALIFVLTISIAVVGYVDWIPPNYHGPNERALHLETALAIASVVLSIYWVIRMRGYRWYATSLSLFQLLALTGANFIAGMALTGRWL